MYRRTAAGFVVLFVHLMTVGGIHAQDISAPRVDLPATDGAAGAEGEKAVVAQTCTEEPLEPGIRFGFGGNVTNSGTEESTGVEVTYTLEGVAEFVTGTENAEKGTWSTVSGQQLVLNIPVVAPGELVEVTFDVQSLGQGTATYRLQGVNDSGTFAEFVCDFIFGEPSPAGLSGFKWNDANGNGQIDGAEEGLAGWTIELDNGQSTTTTADGTYSFPDLEPGTYTVSEVQQDGWTQTFPAQGGSHTVTLESGDFAEGLHFGNQVTGADLTLDIEGPSEPVARGEEIPWTITVENQGPAQALNAGFNLSVDVGQIIELDSDLPVCDSPTPTQQTSCAIGNIIPPGDVRTYTFVTRVEEMPPGAPTQTMAGDVFADTGDPFPGNNTDEAAAAIEQTNEADLAVTLDDSDPPVVGGLYEVEATVVNNGPDMGTAELTVDLPNQFFDLFAIETAVGNENTNCEDGTGGGSTANGSKENGTVTCIMEEMEPDEERTVAVESKVAADAGGMEVRIAASTQTGDNTSDPEDENNTVTIDRTVEETSPADLVVDKTVDKQSISEGEVLTYTVSITNQGEFPAFGVRLFDDPPRSSDLGRFLAVDILWDQIEITNEDDPAYEGDCGDALTDGFTGRFIECALGDLAVDATANVLIPMQVRQGETGTLTNDAEVRSLTPEENVENNTDDAASAIDGGLLVEKGRLFPNESLEIVGQPVPFHITVENTSVVTAENVVLTDALPDDFDVSFEENLGLQNNDFDTCEVAEGQIVCEKASLAAGESAEMGYAGVPQAAAEFTNIASATSSNVPGTEDESSFSVFPDVEEFLPPEPEPSSQEVAQGEEGSVDVTTENSSEEEVTIRTRTEAEEGVEIADASAEDGECKVSEEENTAQCAESVPPGDQATVTITFAGTTVGAHEMDFSAGGESSTGTITVVSDETSADLSLRKTVSSSAPPGRVGVPFTYELTMENDGPADATGVTILDVLPDSLLFVDSRRSSDDSPCAPTDPVNTSPDQPSEVLCAVGTLSASEEVTIFVDVKPLAARTFSNTAEIFSSDQFDPDSTPNNARQEEDDLDTVDATVERPVTVVADQDTRFHRLWVIGHDDNGLLNPYERSNRLDDKAELEGDLNRAVNQASGSTSSTLVEPTGRELAARLDSLKEIAEPGDEVTFIYQGHGWDGVFEDGDLYDPNNNGDESSTGDETIHLNDGFDLTDDSLAVMLQGFDPGVTLVVLMTSCYGGGFADSPSDIQEGDDVTVIGASTTCPQDGGASYLDALGIVGAFIDTLPEDIAAGAGEGEADLDGDQIVTGDELETWLEGEGWDLGSPGTAKSTGNRGLASHRALSNEAPRIKNGKSDCSSAIAGPCPGMPETEVRVSVSNATSQANLHIAGQNFGSETTATLEVMYPKDQQLETQIIGTAPTDVDGAFEASFEVPSSIPRDNLFFLLIEDGAGFTDSQILDLRPVVVDDSGDRGDSDPSDAICDDGTGACPLRAAIEHANAFLGPAVLDLSPLVTASTTPSAKADVELTSIQLQSSLPPVTDPVIVDGKGLVNIDGREAPEITDGLTIHADSSRIMGLAITGFGRHGVVVNGSANRVENTEITGNGGDGIRVLAGVGNQFLGNAIAENGGIGIDLGGDGATPNDPDDVDTGPNNLQNAPELTDGKRRGEAYQRLRYRVASGTAEAAYPLRIEFFRADPEDEEGAAFLGSDIYSTEEAGQISTVTVTPAAPIRNGDRVVATATDAEGNTSEFSMPLLPNPAVMQVDVDRSFGEASSGQDYALVALPGAIDTSLAQTLDGAPGAQWQAYWDDGSDDDFLIPFDGSETFTFRPGRGFWLIGTEAWTVEATVETVSLNGESAATIPLHAGWNIVANPLAVDVPWDQVEAANPGALQSLWQWDGAFIVADTFRTAASGEAFYFLNDAPLDSLSVPYPRTGAADPSEAKTSARPALTLTTNQAGTRSSQVRIGLDPEAEEGLDAFDQFAPPGRFEGTTLRILAPAGTRSGRLRYLAHEWRPPASGQTFDLVVRTSADERATPVRIVATGAGASAPQRVMLINEQTGRAQDLRSSSALTLPPRDSTALTLAIGSEAFVERQRAKALPEAVALRPGYPNPFRDQTTLTYALPERSEVRVEVYDVLGRRVRVLIDKPQPAGRHRIHWNGRNSAGQSVSSGLYLIRLNADGQRHVQKVTRVR